MVKGKLSKILIALVGVLIAAVTAVIAAALSDNSFTVYAEAETDTGASSTTYRQLIRSTTRERLDGDPLTLTLPNDADHFELIFKLTGSNDYTEEYFLCSAMFTNKAYYPNDVNIQFGSYTQTVDGYTDLYKYITYGNYTDEEFLSEYGQKFNVGYKSDWVYLTLTDERAFMSYFCVETMSPSDKGEYADSLNNVLVSFDKGSDNYNYIFDALANGKTMYLSGNKLEQTINYYKDISAPVKEGYEFTGWYYDEACTQLYKGEAITDDVNLYAGFKPITYTVHYDCSEIDTESTLGLHDRTDKVNYGGVASYIPADDVEGKTFIGWYFENGAKYENAPIYADTTLIGRWGVKQYTLTLHLEGGEGETSVTVAHGSTAEIPTPTRENYRFTGWLIDNMLGFDETEPVTASMNLYAQWARGTFKVTFYVDGEIYNEITVKYGQSLAAVLSENDVAVANVVSYCNVNTYTPAVALAEVTVCDDMQVYLGEKAPQQEEKPKSVSPVKVFFNNVGNFFVINRVPLICIGAGVAVTVLAVIVVVLSKRKH